MPLIKEELNYFNLQSVVTPPTDELPDSHFALASFRVASAIVDEAEAVPMLLVVVQTQVRSFLQEAKKATAATAAINNVFFMLIFIGLCLCEYITFNTTIYTEKQKRAPTLERFD